MPLLRSPVLGCHPALAHVGPLVALAIEGTALLFKSVGVGRSDRRLAASGLPRQARPDFALGPERDITRTADFGRQGRRSHQG